MKRIYAWNCWLFHAVGFGDIIESSIKVWVIGLEYIRKTMNSKDFENLFDLPENFRNRQVQVVILPVDEASNHAKINKSLGGSLHRFANPALIELEKGAWADSHIIE